MYIIIMYMHTVILSAVTTCGTFHDIHSALFCSVLPHLYDYCTVHTYIFRLCRNRLWLRLEQSVCCVSLYSAPCCLHLSGPGDLGQVLRVLHDAGLAAKWRAIGQTLTVSNDDLAGFNTRFNGDPSLCLLQVVASWLCGQMRHPDPPSWWRLVRAVADPQGGDTVHGGKRIAAMFRGVCVCGVHWH